MATNHYDHPKAKQRAYNRLLAMIRTTILTENFLLPLQVTATACVLPCDLKIGFRLNLRFRGLFRKLSFYLLLLIFQVASCGTNAEVAAGLNTQASSRSLVQTRFVFKLSLQDYTIASITFSCKEGCWLWKWQSINCSFPRTHYSIHYLPLHCKPYSSSSWSSSWSSSSSSCWGSSPLCTSCLESQWWIFLLSSHNLSLLVIVMMTWLCDDDSDFDSDDDYIPTTCLFWWWLW